MTSSTSEKPVISSDSAESILGEVGTLLRDLTEIQSSLLSVLKQKRDAMATGALDSLNDLQKIEEQNHRRLKAEHVRRLQLEHLKNWVIAQKSLLHVSQILEIVATGGKIQPTYGKSESSARGALVDQEA